MKLTTAALLTFTLYKLSVAIPIIDEGIVERELASEINLEARNYEYVNDLVARKLKVSPKPVTPPASPVKPQTPPAPNSNTPVTPANPKNPVNNPPPKDSGAEKPPKGTSDDPAKDPDLDPSGTSPNPGTGLDGPAKCPKEYFEPVLYSTAQKGLPKPGKKGEGTTTKNTGKPTSGNTGNKPPGRIGTVIEPKGGKSKKARGWPPVFESLSARKVPKKGGKKGGNTDGGESSPDKKPPVESSDDSSVDDTTGSKGGSAESITVGGRTYRLGSDFVHQGFTKVWRDGDNYIQGGPANDATYQGLVSDTREAHQIMGDDLWIGSVKEGSMEYMVRKGTPYVPLPARWKAMNAAGAECQADLEAAREILLGYQKKLGKELKKIYADGGFDKFLVPANGPIKLVIPDLAVTLNTTNANDIEEMVNGQLQYDLPALSKACGICKGATGKPDSKHGQAIDPVKDKKTGNGMGTGSKDKTLGKDVASTTSKPTKNAGAGAGRIKKSRFFDGELQELD